MFGTMTNEEVELLLEKQIVGRIGCHANETTYIVPLSYVYTDGYIYAHSFNGMKINMMRKKPKVCFQVDDTRSLANWQSVVCQGVFEELVEQEARNEAFHKLTNRKLPIISSQTMHLTDNWPFESDLDQKTAGIFFRIRIMEKTGRFEKADDEYFFAS